MANPKLPTNGSETNILEAAMLDFDNGAHTSHILSQLREMHKRGQFCDAKLIVGEHEIDVHRAVLASASLYFFKLFEESVDEDKKQEAFKLRDIQWETFKPLLDYIYTGRLLVPEVLVKSVYKLSQDLRIHSATEACSEYLITSLTPDNCLGIRSFAVEEAFRDKINQYISDNIVEVTNSNKFYGLERISLEIVVPDEHQINLECNVEVADSILDWLRIKLPDYKNKVEALAEDIIVLYLNSDGTLTDCNDVEDDCIQENELVQDYKILSRKKQSGKVAAKDTLMVEPMMNYRKFSIEPYSPKEKEWALVASYKTKDRSYMVITMLNSNLVTMSIHYRPASSNSSGTDDPESPVHSGHTPTFNRSLESSPLKGMSTNRCAFGLKVLDGKLFACGGYDRGECLKSTEIFDPEQNAWLPTGDMRSARGRFSIGTYNGKIYAFGGSSGNHDMKTVECYDGVTEKWTVVAEAPQGKASPGIAVVHGKLYVLGGCIGQNTVSTCETLDLTTYQWQSIPAMRLQRFQVAVTVFRNKIYAIGGTNGWKCLNEVEVFDPAMNEWSQTSHLNIARRGAGVDVYQGNIYVVGGNDGQSALNSIEIYDPEAHTWHLGPSLGTQRANVGVAVLEDKLYAVGGFNGKKFLNSIELLDLRRREHWRSIIPFNGEITHQSNGGVVENDQDSEVVENGVHNNTQNDDVMENGTDVIGQNGGQGTKCADNLFQTKFNGVSEFKQGLNVDSDRNS